MQWTPLVGKTIPWLDDRKVSAHIFSYVSETHTRRNLVDLREQCTSIISLEDGLGLREIKHTQFSYMLLYLHFAKGLHKTN